MGFKKRRNYRNNNYKKDKAKPKLAIVGAITLAIGILLIEWFWLIHVQTVASSLSQKIA